MENGDYGFASLLNVSRLGRVSKVSMSPALKIRLYVQSLLPAHVLACCANNYYFMNVICVCVYSGVAKWEVTRCSTLLSHVSTKRLTVYTRGTTGQTIVHCGQLFWVDMSPGTQSPSICMFLCLFIFCPFLSTHPFVHPFDSSFFLSVHPIIYVPIISDSVLIWCKLCSLYWPIITPSLWSVTTELRPFRANMINTNLGDICEWAKFHNWKHIQ